MGRPRESEVGGRPRCGKPRGGQVKRGKERVLGRIGESGGGGGITSLSRALGGREEEKMGGGGGGVTGRYLVGASLV